MLIKAVGLAGILATLASYVYVDGIAAVGVGCVSLTCFLLAVYSRMDAIRQQYLAKERRKLERMTRDAARPLIASARRLPNGEVEVYEEDDDQEDDDEEEEWDIVDDDEGEEDEDLAPQSGNRRRKSANNDKQPLIGASSSSSSSSSFGGVIRRGGGSIEIVEENGDGGRRVTFNPKVQDDQQGQLTELQRKLRE